MSPRCPSSLDRAHDPTLIGSVALRKGPRRFCPHRSDRCRVLMLTCRNSPLWQRCERCNNVLSSFWSIWLDQNLTACHHVTCALIGTSRTLAALREPRLHNTIIQYNYASGEQRRAGGYKLRYPKCRSRTCYQECDCHLKVVRFCCMHAVSLARPYPIQYCLLFWKLFENNRHRPTPSLTPPLPLCLPLCLPPYLPPIIQI